MSTERTEMIRECLAVALNPQHIEIIDESARHAGHAGARGGGGHFIVKIVADVFAGKSLIQRHRLVYDTLGDAMQNEIHALSITAQTTDEAAECGSQPSSM